MSNFPNLANTLNQLSNFIESRLKLHLEQIDEVTLDPPRFFKDDSPFAKFLEENTLEFEEFVVFALALVPHVQPNFFQDIIARFFPNGGDLPEFGGLRSGNHRGILPTGETAQFVLAGDDLEKRLEVQQLLGGDHWFAQRRILWLEPVREGEPAMSGRILLDPELVETLTTGKVSRPRFGPDFPAEHITTQMEWSDLVLVPETQQQIAEIQHWMAHNDTLLFQWGMERTIKPGYRALFYGPPGTGKTLTASLLGKQSGLDVFRIDLSRVVSKFIGETEKNLSKLFDKAEHKNWILFFDEADALFGKRTNVQNAHDKYANQETAYLLQRVEGYNGLVILATNQRDNMDEAFTRRFQTIIHFPMPGAVERLLIWQNAFPTQIAVAPDVDWVSIANRYELSGASIVNIVHYCAIQAMANGTQTLDLMLLEAGIRRELVKEGKVI
jgi:hypothetical protein